MPNRELCGIEPIIKAAMPFPDLIVCGEDEQIPGWFENTDEFFNPFTRNEFFIIPWSYIVIDCGSPW